MAKSVRMGKSATMYTLLFRWGWLLIACTVSYAATPAPTPYLPPHPRLLATPADFARIRAAVAQPGPMHDVFELVRETADREYEELPLQRVLVGRRMLDVSRNAVRRIWNYAFLYQVTGDITWANRGEEEMLALAKFSDWNPSHFLDTAEAAAAVAIGYDWLFDTLSPHSRGILREALVKKALLPGSSDNVSWRRGNTNWRQVCESGLALAALSIASYDPPLAWATIERAKRNVPLIFTNYEPAGSYIEGPSYWEYGTTYHVLLIEALRTATGSAGALAKNAAFLKSGSVIDLLTAPSGGFFNYGDCHTTRSFMPAIYWFARETRQPGLAANELARMLKAARPGAGGEPAPFPNRFLILALLWMTANPPPAPDALPSNWSTQGPNPVALFRQGVGREALYAGIKGGRARLSHSHMDAGSFILEVGGVRWTEDLGMPVYEDVEKAGYDLFGRDRWRVYATGPNSHSIPLINDVQPKDQTTATLASFTPENQSAVIDLSPLYSDQAKRLRRSLRVSSPTSIVVRDTIDGGLPRAKYRFSWMTRAMVETNATGAVLRKGGRALRLEFSSDAPFVVVNEDASQPPAVCDAPRPGLRRVGVRFTLTKPVHTLDVRATLEPIAPQSLLTNHDFRETFRDLHGAPTHLPYIMTQHEPRFLSSRDRPPEPNSPLATPDQLVGLDFVDP
jgi:hypothetical protein